MTTLPNVNDPLEFPDEYRRRRDSAPGVGAGLDDALVSESPAIRRSLDMIDRVAPTNATVLITGETGTGKELTARVIHRRSQRAGRPFVAVNLAAIPDTLIATELFGHEAGAFTGASQRRVGRFEMADRATLFLDEIGDLAVDLQVALLRVLQEGEFERLGASQTRRADVRLIAATNQNLEQAVEARRFREDLLYRLSVFPIHLPPLRERREDIPLLAEHLLEVLTPRTGRRFTRIEPASLDRLMTFSWPGNIRQLQNVIERSAILCDAKELLVPCELLREKAIGPKKAGLPSILQEDEVELITAALDDAEGRVSGPGGAAERLRVPASTLESKIRRFHIDKWRYRRPGP